jgi:manganese efflux pump family protein
MSAVTIILIALGLAMDAFAVSVASGITIKRQKVRSAFKFGMYFGSFQMIMPVAGWLAGVNIQAAIAGIDHWIAFALLAFIGCKMVYESFKLEEKEEAVSHGLKVMLFLSVATSIDALAVGLSFAFLEISIVTPVIIIGVVTFVLSFIGVFVGNTIGHFFEKKLEALGGLILIGIGIKILLEHLL